MGITKMSNLLTNWILRLICLVSLVYPTAALAQDSFYKGKTIRFVVAYEPGGGFDVYTRTIARHFAPVYDAVCRELGAGRKTSAPLRQAYSRQSHDLG